VSRKTAEEIEIETRIRNTVSILNGVDKELFKPMSKDAARSYLEQRYGVRFGGYVIAHVDLGPIKGTYMLVKALVILKKMGVELAVLFVGRMGPPPYKKVRGRHDLEARLERESSWDGYPTTSCHTYTTPQM